MSRDHESAEASSAARLLDLQDTLDELRHDDETSLGRFVAASAYTVVAAGLGVAGLVVLVGGVLFDEAVVGALGLVLSAAMALMTARGIRAFQRNRERREEVRRLEEWTGSGPTDAAPADRGSSPDDAELAGAEPSAGRDAPEPLSLGRYLRWNAAEVWDRVILEGDRGKQIAWVTSVGIGFVLAQWMSDMLWLVLGVGFVVAGFRGVKKLLERRREPPAPYEPSGPAES